MSNWKVGPGGRLYHPTTGAYVGQLDDNGNEQMVVSAFPSDGGVRVSTPLPSKKLRPVARRTNKWVRGGPSNNISDGVSTGITTQLYHTTDVACSGIRLVFANVYNNNGVETDGTNDINVKANIRLTGGLNFPVFFGGRRTVVVEPGAVVVSDPVGISSSAAATFFSRTFVSVSAGGKYPLGVLTNSANEGVGNGDLADGSVPTNATRGFGPIAILGTPAIETSSPIILAQGESITCGYGDSFGTTDDYGFVSRAFDGVLSYLNLGLSSSSISAAILGVGAARRFRVADVIQPDAALLLYGTNDAAGGDTLNTLRNNLIAWWLIHWRRGLKCFAGTIPPKSTSTDSWATTTNQTADAVGIAARLGVNAWIRDGAPLNPDTLAAVATGGVGIRMGSVGHPVNAYFDFADATESARDSGFWKPGYTSDGTHPNQTGSAAMAAAIDPSIIVTAVRGF